jgi:hypothetical protein
MNGSVEKLKHRVDLLSLLGLSGLVHVSGLAGSGKTLFAITLASECAKTSHVEWISTDGKNSFISYLKRNLSTDYYSNISVQRPSGYHEVKKAIIDLPKQIHDNTSLIVIDPITRALDMSYENPIMWGRSFIEEILPTLAGVSVSKKVTILMISESRFTHEGQIDSVFRDVIVKWLDQDVVIKRDILGKISKIYTYEKGSLLAELSLNEQGNICIKPTTGIEEVVSQCL